MNRLLLVIVFFALTFVCGLPATRPPLPPKKQDVVGVWIGYEKEYPDFYRLRLDNNNTGRLVVAWSEGTVHVYGVRWGITNHTVTLKASPGRGGAPPVTCSVTMFNQLVMELQVKGLSNEWQRVAYLLNEKQLSKRMADAKRHDE